MQVRYDFNVLEKRAAQLFDAGRPEHAIRIYFLMADGDPSMDGGYLAKQLAFCYEAMGQLYAAKYWHGIACEESGGVLPESAEARERLMRAVSIDDLIAPSEYIRSEQ